MIRWRAGAGSSPYDGRGPALWSCTVAVDGEPRRRRALCLPGAGRSARRPATGVLLNTTRAGRWGSGTGGYALVVALPDAPPGRPAAGRRAPGQGPLHPAAGDRAGRGRAGLPAPRRAARRRRPRRDAGGRRRPALGPAGGGGGRPGRAPRRAGRVRHDRRRRAADWRSPGPSPGCERPTGSSAP